MKQIFIGTFPIGHENVDLYAMPDEDGGCFYTQPNDKDPARIKVGLAKDSWPMVVEVLLHEAMEMATARYGGRFYPCGNMANGSDRYHFAFDHNQFSEICAAVALFITPALPKLAQQWTKLQKKLREK